jgi:HD-GYP domain-containing protein (c-di-GMP phosphodiesterase class II)
VDNDTDAPTEAGVTDPAGPETNGPRPTYFGGGTDESQASLLSLGILEPVDSPEDAELFVLSTRLRRSEVATAMATAKMRKVAVVVLTHTGGEDTAVEMMRSGGAVVVAEGNEPALLPYLMGGANDSGMLETYERRIGSASTQHSTGDDDTATGLPGMPAFDQRLEQLNQSGELPRLAFLKVLNLDRAVRMSPEAVALLRRRLALQYLALARMMEAELYVLRDNEFAVVALGLSPNRTETLAQQLARVTESFAPSGAQPLALAVGHAGPEVAMELATLRELASRAAVVAAEAGSSRVVGADSLSLGVAATTELEAALRIIEVVERRDAYDAGHAARVASLAHDIARQLGFEPGERTQVRLAGHLADIGKIGLPPRAMGDPEKMTQVQTELYRSHPARGADSVRTSAGEMVADAIASHHERWDGSGFPNGVSGNDIPIISRIIAAADLWDQLTRHADESRRLSVEDAVEALRTESGVGLDPSIVEAALAVVGDRHRMRVR